jgi:hypothetical protein
MHNDANSNEIHRFYAPSIDLEGSSSLSSTFFRTSSYFFHSPKVLARFNDAAFRTVAGRFSMAAL